MKHKYYSVLAGDLLIVFYGPSRLFHFEPIHSLDGAKMETPNNNHPTTRKQILACLICDPNETRTHSGELTSDLEH